MHSAGDSLGEAETHAMAAMRDEMRQMASALEAQQALVQRMADEKAAPPAPPDVSDTIVRGLSAAAGPYKGKLCRIIELVAADATTATSMRLRVCPIDDTTCTPGPWMPATAFRVLQTATAAQWRYSRVCAARIAVADAPSMMRMLAVYPTAHRVMAIVDLCCFTRPIAAPTADVAQVALVETCAPWDVAAAFARQTKKVLLPEEARRALPSSTAAMLTPLVAAWAVFHGRTHALERDAHNVQRVLIDQPLLPEPARAPRAPAAAAATADEVHAVRTAAPRPSRVHLDENALVDRLHAHLDDGSVPLGYDNLVAEVGLDRMVWYDRNRFFFIVQRLTRLVDGVLLPAIRSNIGIRTTSNAADVMRQNRIPYGNVVHEMRWLGRAADEVGMREITAFRFRRLAVQELDPPLEPVRPPASSHF